jgi:hypothetical protein
MKRLFPATTIMLRGLLIAVPLLGGLALLPGRAQEPKPTAAPAGQPSRVRFAKHTINAASDFECACAADINGDGKLDIVSGDTWYEAPNWMPHKFREIGDWGRGPDSSGYRKDFADLPIDVNGDGRIDIVSSDYATGEIFWHENPGKSDALWQKHLIATPGSAETTVIAPILGKKAICILPNCGNQVVWYELRKAGPEPQWVEHPVGKEGAGHGVGYGDVNGDGKTDIITPHGWYEQVDAANDKWIWHKDFECDPGDLGIGTPVADYTGAGHNDIVFGSGHHYGLYWLQQASAGSPQKWTTCPIDTTWSQAHTLILADLEGNRHPVVLTGKRYKAHDHDPGAGEPLGLYYYAYDRRKQEWQKFVIDQGTQTGTGLQLTAVDLRHTGRLDIIAPGKSGLYVFYNEGRAKPLTTTAR